MHCNLCCTRDKQQRASMSDPRELQALMRHCCIPTPFLYSHVAHTPIQDDVGLVQVCLPCIHWTPRCKLYQHKHAHARGGGGGKPSLPATPWQHMLVDSIIVSVLQLGLTKSANPRCMHSLAACMASYNYLYCWVVSRPSSALCWAGPSSTRQPSRGGSTDLEDPTRSLMNWCGTKVRSEHQYPTNPPTCCC